MSVSTSILLTLAASGGMNLGLVLLKRGLPPARQGETGLSIGKRIVGLRPERHWYAGLALLLGGYVVYGVAVSARTAPISLLQPLFASGIIVGALLAVFYLNERFTPSEWIGLVLLVSGVILVGTSARPVQRGAARLDPGRLALFLAIALGLALLVALAARRRLAANVEFLYGLVAGLLLGVGYLETKVMSLAFRRHERLLGDVSVGLMVLGLVSGLIALQVAFRRGRSLIVTAVNLVTNQVLVISGGLLCLGESFPREPTLFWSRVVGLAGIGCGVILLARVGGEGARRRTVATPRAWKNDSTARSLPA